MHSSQRVLLAINVVGGAAVLGSYAQGLTTHPGLQNALWGGVPETIQTPYTAWMFVAAAGYFAFSYFLLLRTNPDEVRVAGRFGYYLFSLLYGGILIPSALWMPLTFRMIEAPSGGLWTAIRLDLAITGLASVALVAALLALRPRRPRRVYWLAVAGSIGFTVQTALIDAIAWVLLFPA